MDERYMGRSGLRVSELGLGTAAWAREADSDVAAAQLRAFRDAGGTLIDTPGARASGAAESGLGRLLAQSGGREEFVLASRAGFSARASGPRFDASRGALLRELDRTLARLQTDHLDLWQLEGLDPHTPFEESLSALDTAVASGRTRYVGIADQPGWALGRAASWQRAGTGRAPVVSAQVEYSLLERGVEREVVPAATAMGLGLLAYSPLGGGVLTSRYRDPAMAPTTARRAGGIVEAVATAADGLGISPITVALAWLRDRPGVAAAVVGARTLAHLTTTIQALSATIPLEIRQALDEVSLAPRVYPEDPR